MQGKDWSLKVDGQLQTALDSQNLPFASAKSATEKELFLTLNSLEDCKAGQIEFKVSTVGLSIYKQLPLDKELQTGEKYDFINATDAMLKDRVITHRPENVVNSFACFDSTGKKVLHIYATQLIDANGIKIWCDSNLANGVLTIILPVEWCNKAVYPIILDPSFGYTDVGGTSESVTATSAYKTTFSLPEDAILNSINVYTYSYGTDVSLGVYNGTDLSEHAEMNIGAGSASWSNKLLADNMYLAGTYGLAFKAKDYNYNIDLYYDVGESGQTTKDNGLNTADNLPASFGVDDSLDRVYSIYVNYTAVTPPEPTPTPEPTVTPTPTPTPNPQQSTMELVIYILILIIISAFALLGFRYWWALGLIGGLLGAIFSYFTLTANTLVIQTVYDQTAQEFVSQTMSMGFFGWVPLVLTALCFVAALNGKK